MRLAPGEEKHSPFMRPENKTLTSVSVCSMGCLRRLVCGYLVLALCVSLPAQQTPTMTPQQAPKTSPQIEQALPSYEGQKVASVELAGRPDLDKTPYLPLLVQKAGEPFSQPKIEETAAALRRTGKFQAVEIQILPEATGVRVLFVLQPAMYFGVYRFPGAVNHFAYSRLLQAANYPPRGGTYTDVEITNARDALLTFFRRSGFFLAEIKPELQVDQNLGIVNVIYNVSLGKRAKFGNVIINGTTPQQTKDLVGSLQSVWARLKGAAIRPGKTFKLSTVQKASQRLENVLNGKGHLGAQVRLGGAEYDRDTNRADVSFNVEPGPIVRVRVQGIHLWPWTRRSLLPVLQQAGVNPELIQEGRQNLLSHLQSKGYFQGEVSVDEQQQGDAQTILYKVTKGPRHRVESVAVSGNHHFSEKDLLATVPVRAGRIPFFSRGKFSDKLVRTSVRNISNLYKADGFSSISVTPQVKTENDGDILVTFRVDEGPQDIVQALHIEGNDTLSEEQFAPKGLNLRPGQPYSQRRANEDRNQIMANYLNHGYLTASFRETVNQAGNEKHKIIVTYQINEGPQVHTADVITLGRKDTKQELVNRSTAALTPGKPLREKDLLLSENHLYNAGIFDWAEVNPRRQITTQTKEDVLVKLHESKPNSITYGIGFEVINRGGSVPSGTVALPNLPPIGLPSTFKTSEKTFWGPRGTIEYTRRNVRGKGESINLSGLAGRLDQRGSVAYINPAFRWTHWTSNFTITGEHNSENPIFTSRIFETGWQLQRALNPDQTQNFLVRYSFNEIGLTHLLIPALVPPEDQHVRLSAVSGTYIRDTRDSALDAHKGIYETAEADLNPSALGSNVDFTKFLAQGAYYKNIGGGIIWANSLRLGFGVPFAGSHVPIQQKFFSGGGSTLRGFPLDGAGPQQNVPITPCGTSTPPVCFIQVPTGGNQLLIVNSEFRIPLSFIMKNLGIATFYDGGNVFPDIGFHGQYTNSIGGGFRYSTPIGPIRFDIGHNLNAPPGIKSTQFFVTLGQAF